MCHTHRSSGSVRRERARTTVTVPHSEGKAKLGRQVGWVVVDFDARALRCERCGATQPLKSKSPTLADLLGRLGEAFQEAHAECEP